MVGVTSISVSVPASSPVNDRCASISVSVPASSPVNDRCDEYLSQRSSQFSSQWSPKPSLSNSESPQSRKLVNVLSIEQQASPNVPLLLQKLSVLIVSSVLAFFAICLRFFMFFSIIAPFMLI